MIGFVLTEVKSRDDLPLQLDCDIIVDAIFGTGFSGAPRGLAAELIEYISEHDAATVSVDLPSGLNADNGKCEGAVVAADYTYTLAQPKFGLCLSPGREMAGDVDVVPIGIPDEIVRSFNLKIDLTTALEVSELFPARKPDSHKGDFGRLLLVAGSTGMTGAAALTGLAAMRSGCGLARLACARTVQPVLAEKLTEVMTHPLPDVAKKGVISLRDWECTMRRPRWSDGLSPDLRNQLLSTPTASTRWPVTWTRFCPVAPPHWC